MKCEIPPAEVSDLVPFSSSVNSSFASKTSKSSFAGVSKNGLWMWVVYDTAINIYNTENSEWFGGYCFGESLKNPGAKITAVAEFSSSHISFPCLLIAVNHDHESLICMYDINVSKIIRAVLVPEMVTTLEVICGNGGACIDTLHLFMQLRYMFGIVAVGTLTGHLYFLDLCLDEDFECDENSPNITCVLKKYELVPELREHAISKEQHIFMLLNDQSVRNGSFDFESRSSSLGYFKCGKVCVTALKYVQSTVSLVMGFNFGGIQMWNLQDLCLLYTVANNPQELPIIAFAFQEPENDPRHFCYLWIIRGHLANERPGDCSSATMYSLIYNKRTFVESFGYLYSDLRNCTKRYEFSLTSDPFSIAQSSSTTGSCLLSCQTVCQTDESHLDVFSANDSDAAAENMSLCFISWLVWSNSENTPTSYHLALFDLNQWYRAEMPSSNLRSDPSDLNPYFAHFTLEEVAQVFDLEPLYGLYAIPHTIKKFKYISPAEEFFFPSSLDFQTILYSTNGICKTTFTGLQKRLLYEIADMGPNVLVNPKDFYSDLIRYGLIPDMRCSSERVPLIIQREMLLQLALEYHMPFFFMKCLKEWRYAESIQEGCTSRALLNWAWKKVIQIKSSIDKLTLTLFNCSGSDVDKSSLKCLYSYRRQLDLIDTIFTGYEKFATPRTDQGIQELKCRKDVVFCINTYLQVILWLRSVRVLPEVSEGEETEKNIHYPVNVLADGYLKRRGHLQKIHGSVGPTDLLLIDGLIREAFSENTWQEKGGNGIYPPPSIYAALSCYLLDDVHLELKHSLMYYLLLDICNAPHNVKNPLVLEVKKFPSVFGMTPSITKLVKAFWYLDQMNFEVAIKKLLDPLVKSSDILPWQHQRIIKSFLYQREARKALKYINHMEPPENTIEDMKLHLSVLLVKGAVIQALYYQRNKQGLGYGTELLNHLFNGCQEMHKLKDLMYLPLNTLESDALVKFLSENDDRRAQEALVMYYLLRCNFFEASKVNEKVSLNVPSKSVAAAERTAGRDALVEGLMASVPETEKKLVEEINRFPTFPFKKTEALKPLSLSIKSASLKQITYADILNSLISEASSAMCASYLDPQTPFKSGSRSSFENIPFLRPPLTPERSRLSSEKYHSTPVIKRTLTSPTSEFSSPSKRSRLLDNAAFRSPLSSKKKIPKHLAVDVASLLQSPPIHRRSSKQVKEVIIKDTLATAPHGILKKKVEPSKLPVSDIYMCKTPSELSDTGDSDEDDADNDMIVDEAHDDVPGKQIRFSVPNTDDLNTSASSSVSAEPPIISSISKASHSTKRFSELSPVPSLEPLHSLSNTILTQRQASLGLRREPLKSVHKDAPERNLFPNRLESYKLAYENQYTESPKTSSQSFLQQDVVTESGQCYETDSDSCSVTESANNPENANKDASLRKNSNIATVQSSWFPPLPEAKPKLPETDVQTSLNISGGQCALDKSSSSSGNSSYNSAVSERSFIVTPRRPLRDSSRNASLSENVMQNCDQESTAPSIASVIQESTAPSIASVSQASTAPSIASVIQEITAPSIAFVIQESTAPSIASVIQESRNEEPVCIETSIIEEEAPVILEYSRGIPSETSVAYLNKNKENLPGPEIEMISVEDECIEDKGMIIVEDQDLVNVEEECSNDDVSIIGEVAAPLSQGNKFDEKTNECNISVDISIVSTAAECHETTHQANSCYEPEAKEWDSAGVPLTGEEVSYANDEVFSSLNVAANTKTEIANVPGECSVLYVEEMKDVSDYPPVKEETNIVRNIEFPREYAVEEETEKAPDNFRLEAHDFETNVPPSSVPTYVPIKERISRSHQSLSTLSKFDEDDETYPSLLLQEQMEVQRYEALKDGKSDVVEDISLASTHVGLSDEKLETIPETSHITDTDSRTSVSSSKSLPSAEDFSRKLSQRFALLSDEPENDYYQNKLFKETAELLKETDVSQNLEFDFEKKPSRKQKTFVFSRDEKLKTETKVSGSSSKTKSKDKSASKEFLGTWHPESYEQFSLTIQQGRSEDDHKETFKSSPVHEKSSISIFDASYKSKKPVSDMKEKKKQESSKKVTSIDKRAKSAIKKAKERGKMAKKIEFSFAEPHSPAGPEILEALTTPSEYPIGNFMFSPPLTRGRMRKKIMDESLGSSFASAVSETSFASVKKPPVDSILEEIMAQKAPETKKLSKSDRQTHEHLEHLFGSAKRQSRSTTKKKTVVKKTSKVVEQQADVSNVSTDASKSTDIENPGVSAIKNPLIPPETPIITHTMTLRRPKKSRTAQLF